MVTVTVTRTTESLVSLIGPAREEGGRVEQDRGRCQLSFVSRTPRHVQESLMGTLAGVGFVGRCVGLSLAVVDPPPGGLSPAESPLKSVAPALGATALGTPTVEDAWREAEDDGREGRGGLPDVEAEGTVVRGRPGLTATW